MAFELGSNSPRAENRAYPRLHNAPMAHAQVDKSWVGSPVCQFKLPWPHAPADPRDCRRPVESFDERELHFPSKTEDRSMMQFEGSRLCGTPHVVPG